MTTPLNAQSDSRWMVVLSPDGAARTVALCAYNALKDLVGTSRCKVFDCLSYRSGFSSMLKQPDDTMVVDLLNQSLIVSALDFGATHLLVLSLAPVTMFTLNILRKQHITTVHWYYENLLLADYWRDVIPGYDHFCAIEKDPLPEICSRVGTQYHFLPVATTIQSKEPQLLTKDRSIDIAFIGVPSRYRIVMLEQLAIQGFSMVIAGSGWNTYTGILEKHIVNGSWTQIAQYAQLLSKAKVGLNLSINQPENLPYVQISPRVFDILYSGCILVTEDVPLLHATIQDYHFKTFTNTTEFVSKIHKAITDYPLLSDTLQKNYEKCAQEDTYDKRVSQILSWV